MEPWIHFFEHENHAWPPALAENNNMRQGNKAALVGCLEQLSAPTSERPQPDVKIIDGAALVHTLDPKLANTTVKTFGEYSTKIFIPYLLREIDGSQRIDVVWDTYKPDSLKACVRQARGSGDILRVETNTSIPTNWKTFLRVDSNKTGLFAFLASGISSVMPPENKIIVTTKGRDVTSIPPSDVSDLQPCTHEEADYRMLLHAANAYRNGYRKIVIQATDTDVVVLAVATASVLHGCDIWVAFGHGKTFRFIAAHDIATRLGTASACGLLFFHALTGCDTVSSFSGIGKKTAWDVWRSMPHLTPLFVKLSSKPQQVTDDDMEQLERFVIVMYSRTSPILKVNEARKYMFAHGNRQIENVPPTRDALVFHVLRASYQAGHIWGQALTANQSLPAPADWGWMKNDSDDQWVPKWTSLPEASKGCRELIKCNCRKSCLGRCSCFQANLNCTQLCHCAGQCTQEVN